MDIDALAAELTPEEGYRSLLYDDANQQPLRRGSTIVGNPTLAIGWNVAARPCPPDLAQIILKYFLAQTWSALQSDHPWVQYLPEPCQEAVADLAYNNGEAGLDEFTTFLGLMQQGKYQDAVTDLQTTLWWKQVGTRGPRIAALIEQGAANS